MLKQKILTQCLAMTCLSFFGINVYAEDFYFTKPSVEKITLEHQGYFGVSNINISDATHFEIHANQCDGFFNENQCTIDVLVKDLAASHTATLNYQVTDLISGQVESISKTFEAAPVMYRLKSTEVEYNEESKRYQLGAGDNAFVVEVIGGFPWINPNISIDTDVAGVQDDCADVVQPGQSCNLTMTPNPTANNIIGNVNAVNALSYAPITVEVLNEIDKPEVLKIAPALTRITLGASKGKVENIDISEFMNSDFIEFSDDLSTCAPDETGMFTLNATESCHIFVHQKPVTFQRTIGLHAERLAIKTPKTSYITEMSYSGYLLLGDNDGDKSSGDNNASVLFYTAADGEMKYAKEKMLSSIVGKNINEINQMTANLYGEFYFANNRGTRKKLYRINFENDQSHELTNDAGSDFWGVATATDHHRISSRDSLSTFFLSTKGLVVQEYRYLNTDKDQLLDSESELDLQGNDFYAAGFSAYHNTFYAVEDGESSQPAQYAVVDISSNNKISSGTKTVKDSKGNGQTNFITLYDTVSKRENGIMMASEDTRYSTRKLFYSQDSGLSPNLWQAIDSPTASQLGTGQIPLAQVSNQHIAVGGLAGRLWLYNRDLNSSEYGFHATLGDTQTVISAKIKGLINQGVIAFNEDFGLSLFEKDNDGLVHKSSYTTTSRLPSKANKNQMVVTAEIEFSTFNDADRYVFITNKYGSGDLSSWADAGGASGIDAGNNICQADADGRGLSGNYHAWLSNESIDAIDNVKSHLEIVYYNLDNSIFAYSDKLITDPLSVEIENPISDRSNLDMWTGTYALGTLRTPNCNNWTSSNSANQGNYGDIDLYNWNPWKWTEFAAQGCDRIAKLYCFEV